MSSILTNNGAMVALQTLKGINSGLAKTQDEISTGKTVATAKDNAAVWAISKVMEADVSGFKAISSSLAAGGAAVGTAREGAEKVTSLLTKMRDTIISAQSPTSDRGKLQNDLVDLRTQIAGTVKAAQINGLNLLDGSNVSVNFLSSIDRSAAGTSASNIAVAGQNLSIGGYAAKPALTGSAGASTNGDAAAFSLNAGAGAASNLVISNATALVAGDSISVKIGDKVASYTVSTEDAAATTPADIVAVGLKSAIEKLGIAGLTVNYDRGTAGTLALTNAAGGADLTVAAQFNNVGSGGLGALAALDISTAAGATTALGRIETMMQTSVNAAAKLGAAGSQIEAQGEFLSKLTDSLKSGIGSLVDANMEEASARLQALQTQQQLGIQSLSIANKAPQNILSLFRG